MDDAAAINKEPAGEEVDSILESVCGDLDKFNIFCTAPGDVVIDPPCAMEVEAFPMAFEPNLAQAFFHLH